MWPETRPIDVSFTVIIRSNLAHRTCCCLVQHRAVEKAMARRGAGAQESRGRSSLDTNSAGRAVELRSRSQRKALRSGSIVRPRSPTRTRPQFPEQLKHGDRDTREELPKRRQIDPLVFHSDGSEAQRQRQAMVQSSPTVRYSITEDEKEQATKCVDKSCLLGHENDHCRMFPLYF